MVQLNGVNLKNYNRKMEINIWALLAIVFLIIGLVYIVSIIASIVVLKSMLNSPPDTSEKGFQTGG